LKRQRGVALLMALSLLAVLSAALMHSLEERALEVRFQAAEREDFFLQLQARSSFRVIASLLQTEGPWFVLESQLGLLPYRDAQDPHLYHLALPIGETILSELHVTLLDHAVMLNPARGVKADAGLDLVLGNLLAQLHEGEALPPAPDTIAFLSSLNDFLDQDQDVDKEFFLGPETYYNQTPAFEVKNRGLDRLSEVKILPSYRSLGLRNDQLQRHFRIHGAEESAIDINLASKQEIEDFLARYKGLPDYQTAYNRRAALARLFTEGRNHLAGPKYTDPTPSLMRREGQVKQQLAALGVELSPQEDALFRAETSLMRLEYSLSLGHRSRRVSCLLELQWGDAGGAPQLVGITLHEFEVS